MTATLTKTTKTKAAGRRRPVTPSKSARRPKQDAGGRLPDGTLPASALGVSKHLPVGPAGLGTHDLPAGRDEPSGAGQGDGGTLPPVARPARTNGRKGRSGHVTQKAVALPATDNEGGGPVSGGTQPGPVAPLANQVPAGRRTGGTPSSAAGRDAIVAGVRMRMRLRLAAILAGGRLTSQCRAMLKTDLGYSDDLTEKERAKLGAAAAAIVEAVESGEADPVKLGPLMAHVQAAAPIVLLFKAGKEPFANLRKRLDKELADLVRQLPVWPQWAEGVKGLSELGVATWLFDLGDPCNYPNPGKVWKRMGVAPRECYRKPLKDGDGTALQVPKVRRSRSWSIVDVLLKQKGPYLDLYRERRAHELLNHPEDDRGLDPKTGKQRISKHADLRARKFVEKRLLREFWRAWLRSVGVEPAVPPHEMDATAAAA